MGFPKWKYHASKGEMIIHSEEQEKELGSEWKESPADFGVCRYPHPSEEAKADSYREWMARWESKKEKAEAKEAKQDEQEVKPKKAKKAKEA